MSARETLLGLLYGARPAALEAAYEAGEHRERERDVDVILSLHAHELAEQQRRYVLVGPCRVACGDEYCESCNVHKLIDLIDPMKENV